MPKWLRISCTSCLLMIGPFFFFNLNLERVKEYFKIPTMFNRHCEFHNPRNGARKERAERNYSGKARKARKGIWAKGAPTSHGNNKPIASDSGTHCPISCPCSLFPTLLSLTNFHQQKTFLALSSFFVLHHEFSKSNSNTSNGQRASEDSLATF